MASVGDNERVDSSKLTKEASDEEAPARAWGVEESGGNTLASFSKRLEHESEPMPSGGVSIVTAIAGSSTASKGKAEYLREAKPLGGDSILAEKNEISVRSAAVKGNASTVFSRDTRGLANPPKEMLRNLSAKGNGRDTDVEPENATTDLGGGGDGGTAAVRHPGAFPVYPNPTFEASSILPPELAIEVGDDEDRSTSMPPAEDIVATLVDERESVVIGVATPLETTFKLFLKDCRVRICMALFLVVIVALVITFSMVFTLQDTSTPIIFTSIAPTAEPTPPADCTNITVAVTCRAADGQTRTCEEINNFNRYWRCEDRPFEVSVRFNGGTCKQITDDATDSGCRDFNGGPPTEGLAYIKVTGGIFDKIFFEGPVIVGNDFHIFNEKYGVPGRVRVTITEGSLPGGVELQQVTANLRCSKDLFLSEEFGSLQVVAFTSDNQTVNRFFHATYRYTVENTGEFNVRLVSLISTRNDDVADLTDDVQGIMVAERAYSFEENVLIDVTKSYEAKGYLTAIRDVECDDHQTTGFTPTSPSSSSPVSAPAVVGCAGDQECIVYFPKDERPIPIHSLLTPSFSPTPAHFRSSSPSSEPCR